MKRTILVGALCLLFASAHASQYYVRPHVTNGYGNGDGKSLINAYNGFDRILWGASGVHGGDTLYVCGTHIGEYFNIPASGSGEGAEIRIDGTCPGGDAGNINPGTQAHGIRVEGQKYIVIANLNIFGGSGTGIGTPVMPNSHLTLDQLDVHDNAAGMDVKSEYLVVKNVRVHDNKYIGAQVDQSPFALIQNALFYRNGQSGIYNHDGLFIGNGSTSFLVEDCKSFDNRSQDGSGFDSSANESGINQGVFRRCVAYGNEGRGFSASGDPGAKVRWEYCLAYRNMYSYYTYEDVVFEIVNCSSGDASYAPIVSTSSTGRRRGSIKNTLVVGTYKYALVIDSRYVDLVSDRNDYTGGTTALIYDVNGVRTYTLSEWQKLGKDQHSISDAPQFVDASGGDFRVSPGSRCLGLGDVSVWTGVADVRDVYGVAITDSTGYVIRPVNIGAAGTVVSPPASPRPL